MLLKSLFIMLAAFTLVACGEYTRPVSGGVSVQGSHGQVNVYFTDRDRYYISEYYTNKQRRHTKKGKKTPPGLAKKDKLTPGHAKQLKRNGHLPPGLEKRSLHYNLNRNLSKLPAGYARFTVGRDVVLFNENTHVIVDIIYDIVQ